MKSIVLIAILTLAAFQAKAQRIGIDYFLMPQTSFYSYSDSDIKQRYSPSGLATGIVFKLKVLPRYQIEQYSTYSHEGHKFDLPSEIDFTGTNGYVKFGLTNSYIMPLNASGSVCISAGLGPQIGILTQSNMLIKSTGKIIDFYSQSTKTDVGLVAHLSGEFTIADVSLRTGFRYERGFSPISKDSAEKVYNNTIGFFISIGGWI